MPLPTHLPQQQQGYSPSELSTELSSHHIAHPGNKVSRTEASHPLLPKSDPTLHVSRGNQEAGAVTWLPWDQTSRAGWELRGRSAHLPHELPSLPVQLQDTTGEGCCSQSCSRWLGKPSLALLSPSLFSFLSCPSNFLPLFPPRKKICFHLVESPLSLGINTVAVKLRLESSCEL